MDANTQLYWDSVCASRQYLEPHFPQLHPEPSPTVPVAVGLMHNLKAGGSTLKGILRHLASAAGLPLCGVPEQYGIPVAATQLTPTQQQQCRLFFTEPGSTLEVAHLTRRPALLVTSLRPPADHWVSYYNYACVCNVEGYPSLQNCTVRTSFEEHSIDVAWQVIGMVLNGHQRILRKCADIATALGADAERRFEDNVLCMLTARLSAPCLSTMPTYEIDAYVPLLSERWQPYRLTPLHPLPGKNAFKAHRCPASQRHWLQDAKSEATLKRLSAAAKHGLSLRVHDQLWQWFRANGRGLWRNSSAPCTIRMQPAWGGRR